LLIATPEGRLAFRTSGPYAALLVFALVIAPHVLWLVQNDFPPFHYALAHFDQGAGLAAGRSVKFAAANLLYVAPLLIAVWMLFKNRGFLAALSPRDASFRELFLPVVGVGPFLLTLGVGFLLQVPLSSGWGIPLWFATSVLLLKPIAAGIRDRENANARRLVAGLLVLLPVTFLSVAALSDDIQETYSFPARQLAAETERRWQEEFGVPLPIVGGWWLSVGAIAFYSNDHPSALIDFDLEASPWLTPARIEEEGIAVVCPVVLADCVERGEAMVPGARSGQFRIEAEQRLFGHSRALSFRYLFVPPADVASPDG
jgi:hypothetical protein